MQSSGTSFQKYLLKMLGLVWVLFSSLHFVLSHPLQFSCTISTLLLMISSTDSYCSLLKLLFSSLTRGVCCFSSQAPWSSQNAPRSVVITHSSSAVDGFIASREPIRGTGLRLEQSTVLWCLHLPQQGQSLGLPSPGATWEGIHRCAEWSRNSCTHHRKI